MQSTANELKDATREAAASIAAEMGIDNCIARLKVLPAQIEKREGALAEARRNLEEAKAGMDLARQIVVATVAEEIGGNGKARYANAEARNAEVIRRLAEDDDYQTARREFQLAETVVSEEQFDLGRLQNEFGANKVIGQILAAKLNLLAGL